MLFQNKYGWKPLSVGLSAFLLLVGFTLGNAAAPPLSTLSSSIFRLQLGPTEQPLGSVATSKLRLSMETLLFPTMTSSSVTTTTTTTTATSSQDFANLLDVDVVLRKLDWEEAFQLTMLNFQVHVTLFHEEAEEDFGTNAADVSHPTRFALDTIVARTFSQPSTKSNFLVQLQLSQDASLVGIQDVAIDLLEEENEESSPSNEGGNFSQFSTLDTVLITASGAILLGVVCIVYFQHRTRERMDEEHFYDMDQQEEPDKAKGVLVEDDGKWNDEESSSTKQVLRPALPEDLEVVRNVDITASMEDDEDEDSNGDGAHSTGYQAPMRDFENVVSSPSTMPPDFSALSPISGSIITAYSPPVSPSPSVPSSSSEESLTTEGSSALSSPPLRTPTKAYLLGMSNRSNEPLDKLISTVHSPLAVRLGRLPSTTTDMTTTLRGSSRSFASAPGKLLIVKHGGGSTSVSCDRSVQSMRSFRSKSRLYEVVEHPELEASATNLTDLAVIAEQHNLMTASSQEDFVKNWNLAKKMAKEDADENGSVVIDEDVFHVDVEQHSSSVEDNRSRMSGLTTVSEWMKSIRVVGDGGTIDSKTSEMSKSSAEHSSIEPKGTQQDRESDSVDYSLERSLAKSAVDM